MPDKVNRRREISGILYLTIAVLLSVSYYIPSARTGIMGVVLVAAGQGMIGLGAYALPVLFLYMAFESFLANQPKLTSERFRYVFLLTICAAALMHILTIDLPAFRILAMDTDQSLSATKSLLILIQSAVDPTRFPELASLNSGGLLGGILALSLAALAGVIGATIILSAFVLTLIVLLFNVSYSRAFGKTAQAISQTHQRMNEAMRTSVSTMRQNAQTDRDQAKEAYDLRVSQQSSGNAAAATVGPGSSTAKTGAFWTKPDPSSVSSSTTPLFQIPGGHDADTASAEQPTAVAGGFSKVGSQMQSEEQSTPTHSSFWNNLFHPQEREKASGRTALTGQDALLGHEDDLSVPAFLQGMSGPVAVGNSGGFVLTPNENSSENAPLDFLFPVDSADEEELDANLPAGVHRVNETNPRLTGRDELLLNPLDVKPELGHLKSDHLQQTRSKRVPPDQIPLPYQLPPLYLLSTETTSGIKQNQQVIQELGRKLEATLKSFGVDAKVVNYTAGATITRFELTPGPGVKVSRIVSLADDIALNLAAMGVRIEAPIPGKSAIGIEIPNKEATTILLRGILESPEFTRATAPLTAALGRDIQGTPILCDLARMPHLLIAGATGSGKSVCINTILMSILFRCTPAQVRLLMIDPKVVELSMYNGIPHLLSPVVTDARKAANTLNWAVNEMVRRYGLFAEKTVRDIHGYQMAAKENPDEFEQMPLILLVIDELADLMSSAPTEVEGAIARLTAMARAAGIHLIIATQRPSVDVITGVIKANIPSRIAFSVASQVDSRTILDMGGAEKLLGKGDMLYYPQSLAKPVRGQGAFVSDSEVEKILNFIKTNHADGYDASIIDAIMATAGGGTKDSDSKEQDELLPNAVEIVVEAGYASVSLLQRRMNVGYPRAARLIDRMQEKGFVGPFEGSKPRKVLIDVQRLMELKTKGEL